MLTLHIWIPDDEKKLTSTFIFTLLCGASKGFNPFMTDAVIKCGANQWTGFYMIAASVMKGLRPS